MRVAIRFIFYKAVTPSCDIVDIDDDTWSLFLRSDKVERIRIALHLLHKKESLESKIREIAWFPLNSQNKLWEVPLSKQ